MRKKHLSIYIILLLFASFTVFLNCSSGDTATVTIDLGFAQQESALNRSVIDRILRFFSTEAIAQEAPANIESVILRVTGPGIDREYTVLPPYTTITIGVPAGKSREFTVLAYVDPSAPGAALSF